MQEFPSDFQANYEKTWKVQNDNKRTAELREEIYNSVIAFGAKGVWPVVVGVNKNEDGYSVEVLREEMERRGFSMTQIEEHPIRGYHCVRISKGNNNEDTEVLKRNRMD